MDKSNKLLFLIEERKKLLEEKNKLEEEIEINKEIEIFLDEKIKPMEEERRKNKLLIIITYFVSFFITILIHQELLEFINIKYTIIYSILEIITVITPNLSALSYYVKTFLEKKVLNKLKEEKRIAREIIFDSEYLLENTKKKINEIEKSLKVLISISKEVIKEEKDKEKEEELIKILKK